MRTLILLSLCLLHAAASHAADYAIVVSKSTAADADWKPVVRALVDRHNGEVIEYEDSVEEAKPALSKMHPRYTCFVAKHSEANRAFVAEVHRLTRAYDADPWADTMWGILTGYDAANALAIANHSEPLTIKKVASGTEIALEMLPEGLWYDELVKNKRVAKLSGSDVEQTQGPDDTTRALAQTLTDYQADLFITSGHATERDWQIGFRYRNGYFVSKAGQMYGKTTTNERFEINSPNPKAYLPIGNCLMGHIDAPDAMALAWMNSCGVKQMAGYTVPTWFGYAGWGLLDYFVEQPGRYTLAESFFANHQALLQRLYTATPAAVEMNPVPGRAASPGPISEAGKAMSISEREATGLLFDRDVLAFYGDPKWQARIQPAPEKLAYRQALARDGDTYTLTITPQRGEDSFKPVNTNGSQRGWRPIIELLPQRIRDIKIVEGADLNPLIADDFILIPNPREYDPDRAYVVKFIAKQIGD